MSFFSYISLGECMKKIILSLLLFLIPSQVLAFGTSASCAILMDQDSGRILYSQNIHTVRSIASISKIMTGLLAVESGKLNDDVVVGDEILDAYGSAIYIHVGEKMTLRDLTYGLMLRSGNDAALAIAQHVGGSVERFVDMMNQKAAEIGMKNTTFYNPHGLDEGDMKGNFSTAYDMALLTSYAMKNSDYQTIVGTKKHIVKTDENTYVWHNKNKLLNNYKYITGGKTGYTEIARRTLVSTASKDGMNLVVVTLNDGNDFSDHQNLYEEAFQTYDNYELLTSGPISILNENYYHDTFYVKNTVTYPLMENETGSAMLKFLLEKKTGYKDGESVGIVEVWLNDQKITEEQIYIEVNEKKKSVSFFSKILNWIRNL